MTRSEKVSMYYKLENDLEAIANSIGKTADQLTAEYLRQPYYIKDQVRPILKKQLKLLKEFKQWHYTEAGNVYVLFPKID